SRKTASRINCLRVVQGGLTMTRCGSADSCASVTAIVLLPTFKDRNTSGSQLCACAEKPIAKAAANVISRHELVIGDSRSGNPRWITATSS
ncbi:MAG: hypothetical protein OJJ21_10305, partial [Ferrovibrio sp.]|uniref:hypothetical protein n=1 Tax=Ferrovibrio sp. TaxID=1917215 RepID=UPI00262B90A5